MPEHRIEVRMRAVLGGDLYYRATCTCGSERSFQRESAARRWAFAHESTSDTCEFRISSKTGLPRTITEDQVAAAHALGHIVERRQVGAWEDLHDPTAKLRQPEEER